MSAAKLRMAAQLMRREGGRWTAVAEWLDMTAEQVRNYGPNAESPWISPHVQMATAVATAYLGEQP